jgi:hypothetical protein
VEEVGGQRAAGERRPIDHENVATCLTEDRGKDRTGHARSDDEHIDVFVHHDAGEGTPVRPRGLAIGRRLIWGRGPA